MSLLFNKFHLTIDQVKRSKKWYDEQLSIMKRGGITPNKVLSGSGGSHVTKIVPGNLYFFSYYPKMAEKLPYYDLFPLVFPFKSVPGGFYGLNMHYLGYNERFALFKKLIEINGSKIDHTLKIKKSWGLVNQMSKYAPSAEACVKHYLYSQIKSPFVLVEPHDWTTAMMMPVERFVGASKESVWNESRK